LDDAAQPTGLESVQCISVTDCTAVGGYSTSQGAGGAIAEHWNGSEWKILSTATVSAPISELHSLSCGSANSCIAVGDEGSTDEQMTFHPHPLVESWNGRVWAVQAAP
jgi:hypothetical protein